MCGFECNLKITFNISYVMFYLTLTLHLQYTSPIQYLYSSYCLSSYNSKEILKISSKLINAHKDTSDRGLSHNFIGLGEVVNVLAGIKTRCWRVYLFSIATELIRALSVPPYENLEGLSQANVGAVPKKLFARMYYFHLLCEELTLDICRIILDTPCIYFSQCQALPVTHTHKIKPNYTFFFLIIYVLE